MNKKIVLIMSIIGINLYTSNILKAQGPRCPLMQATQEVAGCPPIQETREPQIENTSPAISQDEAVTTLLGIVCALKKQIEADKEKLQNLEREYHATIENERRQRYEQQQEYGYISEVVPMSYGIERKWKKQNQLIKQKEKERAAIEYALEQILLKTIKPHFCLEKLI
ncbi:MAG TPA: hypothetical protein VGW78_04275 [Candidatus Babeliales bacterium]|jgi:hypothetical protein|nr:hypothetical protein [Candidatus Babeliales bacterium]